MAGALSDDDTPSPDKALPDFAARKTDNDSVASGDDSSGWDKETEQVMHLFAAQAIAEAAVDEADVAAVCVCVFLASGYDSVTVMHEITISSAQTMTSFHTLELSCTIPLVPLERGLFHMRRFQRVCSI